MTYRYKILNKLDESSEERLAFVGRANFSILIC